MLELRLQGGELVSLLLWYGAGLCRSQQNDCGGESEELGRLQHERLRREIRLLGGIRRRSTGYRQRGIADNLFHQ
ncbi:MAG: hypothetical protein ACK5DM_13975 [Planctomyces sp.]